MKWWQRGFQVQVGRRGLLALILLLAIAGTIWPRIAAPIHWFYFVAIWLWLNSLETNTKDTTELLTNIRDILAEGRDLARKHVS